MQTHGMQRLGGLERGIELHAMTSGLRGRLVRMLTVTTVILMMGAVAANASGLSETPGSLTFGDQTQGIQTPEQVITITNTNGTGGASITFNVTHPTDFLIDASPSGHCLSVNEVLAAQASCTVNLYFKPTGTGVLTENLNITISGGGGTTLLSLTGTGLAYSTNVYYVSPNGNDSWSGNAYSWNGLSGASANGPLKTLHQAHLSVAVGGAAGKKVEFESGTYYVGRPPSDTIGLYSATVGGNTTASPIATVCSAAVSAGTSQMVCPEVFTAGDSGSSSSAVTYEAFSGATPVLSGGVRIPASAWTLVSGSSSVYYADLNPSYFDGYNPVDFGSLYVDSGDGTTGVAGVTRRFRPRAQITGTGDASGMPSGYLRVMEPVEYDNTQTGYTGGPGSGSCGQGDNSVAFCAAASICGAANVATRTYSSLSTHATYYCNDRFAYYKTTAHPDLQPSWTNFATATGGTAPQSMEISIDEQFSMSKMRLESVYPGSAGNSWVDSNGNTVPVAIMNGPLPLTGFGAQFRSGFKYLVENVQPSSFTSLPTGEWFIDETATPYWRLYYHPASGETVTSGGNTTVIVPQAAQLIVSSNTTSGQDANHLGAKFITFNGLTFAFDNWTVPPTGYQGSQQEPRMTGAISFVNPQNIIFSVDTIAHVGDFGIEYLNDNTALGGSVTYPTTSYACGSNTSKMPDCNVVQDSLLYDLGGGGIRVGSFPSTDEKDKSEVQGTTITDNLIQGYGRLIASAEGISVGPSHDNNFTYNEITDGYKDGIAVCLPQGPITACRLFDSGGSPVEGANGAYSINITNNLIHNIGQGTLSDMAGVYFAAIESNSSDGVGSGGVLPDNDLIQYNTIYDITHPTEDNGSTSSIYTTTGATGTGTVTNPVGYGGNGVYTDQQSQAVTVNSNLIFRVTAAGWNITYGPSDPAWYNSPLEFTNNIVAYFGSEAVDLSQQSLNQSGQSVWPKKLDFKNNIVFFDAGFPLPSTGRYASVQGGSGWSCGENAVGVQCTGNGSYPATSYFDFEKNAYYDADTNTTSHPGNLNSASAFYVDNSEYVGSTAYAIVPSVMPWTPTTSGSWEGSANSLELREDPSPSTILSSATANAMFTSSACSAPGADSYVLTSTGNTVANNISFTPWLGGSTKIGRTNQTLVPPSNLPAGWPLYFPGGATVLVDGTGAYSANYCSWF